jgi:O-antigen/teichoic acid export membrane protein
VFLLGLGTITVTGLILLVTRMYADRYGAADLSAILIFRLYGSVLFGVFGLGMPIALQRNVAFLGASTRGAGAAAMVGLGIGLGSFGIACLVSAWFSPQLASFLGNPDAAALWRAFLALAFTQALGSMVALIQVARSRWLEASIVTAATMGLAPLLSLFFWPHGSLAAVLFWASALAGAFALPSLFEILRWSFSQRRGDAWQDAKLLLRYGLPRAPGNAAEPFLDLMLPSLALISGSGLLGAGALAIGLALLRPLNPVTGAMSLALTPSAARLAASGDVSAQANQTHRVAQWACHIGLFAVAQLVIWADVLVTLWLGRGYTTGIGVVRIVCLALAPSFFYASVRGIIDGENERPINTVNLFLSMGVLLVAALVSRYLRIGNVALAVSYLLSRAALAWLTLRYVVRRHAAEFAQLRVMPALAWTVFLALLALLARFSLPGKYALTELIVIGPLSLGLFVWGMALCGAEWARRFVVRERALL